MNGRMQCGDGLADLLHFPKQSGYVSEYRAVRDADGFHCWVFRLKANVVALFEEALNGRLFLNQRDDNISVSRGRVAADNDVISVIDAGIDHAFALYAKNEMVTFTDEIGG